MEKIQSFLILNGFGKNGVLTPTDYFLVLGFVGIFIIYPAVLLLLWIQKLIFKTGFEVADVFLLIYHLTVLALGCFILYIIGKAILLILYTPIPGW